MSSTTRALLIIAAIVVIAAGMKAAQEVIVPLLLAVFIATISGPPVFWLERRKVPSALAITGVMVAMILTLAAVAALVFRSGNAFTARLPFYQARIEELMGELVAWFASFGLEINTELAMASFNPATALDLAGNLLRALGSAMSDGFPRVSVRHHLKYLGGSRCGLANTR